MITLRETTLIHPASPGAAACSPCWRRAQLSRAAAARASSAPTCGAGAATADTARGNGAITTRRSGYYVRFKVERRFSDGHRGLPHRDGSIAASVGLAQPRLSRIRQFFILKMALPAWLPDFHFLKWHCRRGCR